MRDWFSTLATQAHQNHGRERAHWARTGATPCETDDSGGAHYRAQMGATRAQRARDSKVAPSRAHVAPKIAEDTSWRETAENHRFPDSRAHRAHCAHENDKVVREPDGNGWDGADWQMYFDERAAITEFDGKLPRAQAEARAFEATVARWLIANPPRDPGPDICAGCNGPVGRPGEDGVPVLAGEERHVWLHHWCYTGWMARRRKEAAEAMAGMGIESPGDRLTGV